MARFCEIMARFHSNSRCARDMFHLWVDPISLSREYCLFPWKLLALSQDSIANWDNFPIACLREVWMLSSAILVNTSLSRRRLSQKIRWYHEDCCFMFFCIYSVAFARNSTASMRFCCKAYLFTFSFSRSFLLVSRDLGCTEPPTSLRGL